MNMHGMAVCPAAGTAAGHVPGLLPGSMIDFAIVGLTGSDKWHFTLTDISLRHITSGGWTGPPLELQQLSYFVHVAELSSFTRASALLGVAQPALSRQVRQLEVELRQTLFTRNGSGSRPHRRPPALPGARARDPLPGRARPEGPRGNARGARRATQPSEFRPAWAAT